MSDIPGLLPTMEAALRYIEHCGANQTARGLPHPQALLVEHMKAHIAALKGQTHAQE